MSPEPTASKDNLAPATSSASSSEAGQSERQSMTIRYVDRADMAETTLTLSLALSSMGRRCVSNLVSRAWTISRPMRRAPPAAILHAGSC